MCVATELGALSSGALYPGRVAALNDPPLYYWRHVVRSASAGAEADAVSGHAEATGARAPGVAWAVSAEAGAEYCCLWYCFYCEGAPRADAGALHSCCAATVQAPGADAGGWTDDDALLTLDEGGVGGLAVAAISVALVAPKDRRHYCDP